MAILSLGKVWPYSPLGKVWTNNCFLNAGEHFKTKKDSSINMETLSKKENVIPPSEVERIIDILPYTPSVKNSHTQPSVKNSHTPPSACGLVWSMGILHLGLSMGILHLGCIRKNIYTPPSFGGRNVPYSSC